MGKSSKAPSAPDPSATIAAQGAANKEAVQESAKVSQINQVTPQGSLTYSGTVGEPDRTLTTTYSPAEQQQYNQQNQVAGTLGNHAINLADQVNNLGEFNYNGFKQIPTDYNQLRNDAIDRVYQGLTRNTERDFGRNEETLRSKLAAQGLNANDEAFGRELQTFDDSKNNAYNAAADSAYSAGATEAQNAYNQDMQTRNQQIAEATNLRNTPINELSAILQGTPALDSTLPGQTNTGQYTQAPVNVAGITNDAYNAANTSAGNQAQKAGGTASTVVGLAGTAAVLL